MEVTNKQVTILTNAEVLKVIKETRNAENKKQKNDRLKNLGTIMYETNTYLRGTAAAQQTDEQIMKLVAELRPYKLTMAETVQMINLRPSTAVDVQLIVEECEERIKSEEQLEALVNVVSECLPSRPASEEQKTDEA